MSEKLITNQKVLVLNKSWIAIGVITFKKAVNLLFKYHEDGPLFGQPKAKIIEFGTYKAYSWDEWSKLTPTANDKIIKGVAGNFLMPEVIMLTSHDKTPSQKLSWSRRAIYKRDQGTCQYCGERVNDKWTIDHIIPKSRIPKGQANSWVNCCLACPPCNSQKADRTPEEATRNNSKNWKGPSPMKLLSVPKKPKFSLFKEDRTTFLKSWLPFLAEGQEEN